MRLGARNRVIWLAMFAALVACQGARAAGSDKPAPQGMEVDLAKPFHTRSAWRFVVTEGPPTKDYGDFDAPGELKLCLDKGPGEPCVSEPVTLPLSPRFTDGPSWAPHYLRVAKPVYPTGPDGAPLLMIVTGSLNSGNGDQVVSTQLLAYDADRDSFRRVYGNSTSRNNNQEIRFVTEGPLRGSVISVEPQDKAPYGYWVVVEKPDAAGAYRQVLRYPSATRYGDGNALSVIDSEMPNIQQRFGLWRPGAPLPTPRQGGSDIPCPKPAMKRGALWCE